MRKLARTSHSASRVLSGQLGGTAVATAAIVVYRGEDSPECQTVRQGALGEACMCTWASWPHESTYLAMRRPWATADARSSWMPTQFDSEPRQTSHILAGDAQWAIETIRNSTVPSLATTVFVPGINPVTFG